MESRMVRVSIPTYTRLLEIAAKEACTIAEASLVLLKPTIQEAEIDIGLCETCGKTMHLHTGNPKEIARLKEAFKGWAHTECPNAYKIKKEYKIK